MIDLELPYPPSVNHYWRRVGARTLISRGGRAFRIAVCSILAVHGIRPIDGALEVVIELFPPDRRRRDVDNTQKALLDALAHGGAWHPIPAVVPHTDEARQILVAARIEAEAEYERAEANNDAVGTTVWGRVSEQSRKLALLAARRPGVASRRVPSPHIRAEGRARVCEETIKADGCMVLPQADFFLAPKDFGVINHRPCHNHAAIGCGISVDAGGYAICSIGGAIDSVLDLKLRTKQLKDLFDPEFAHRQTCSLCDVCGRELGITSHHIAKSQVLHGSLMSPTWQAAVKRIEQRKKQGDAA